MAALATVAAAGGGGALPALTPFVPKGLDEGPGGDRSALEKSAAAPEEPYPVPCTEEPYPVPCTEEPDGGHRWEGAEGSRLTGEVAVAGGGGGAAAAAAAAARAVAAAEPGERAGRAGEEAEKGMEGEVGRGGWRVCGVWAGVCEEGAGGPTH